MSLSGMPQQGCMAVESEKETRHEVSLLGHRQQLGQECEDALLVTTPYEKH